MEYLCSVIDGIEFSPLLNVFKDLTTANNYASIIGFFIVSSSDFSSFGFIMLRRYFTC